MSACAKFMILLVAVCGVFFSCVVRAEELAPATGLPWAQVTANAPWTGRATHQCVVFDNKLWLIGGTANGTDFNDVWCSGDGTNWTLKTEHAAWPARGRHRCLVFDGYLWVLGGSAQGPVVMNDVWRSSDGTNWVQVTAHAAWSARDFLGAVVFNDQMWVLGGYGDDGYVWSSCDGTNWTNVAHEPAWGNKTSFGIASYAGKLWIMGGQYYGAFNREVWNTADGSNWTLVTRLADWSPRSEFGLCVANEQMWLLGGNNAAADVWNTTNGSNWFRVQTGAPWGVRSNFGSSTLKEGLWILGGANYADVWYAALASDSPTGMIAYWSMDAPGSIAVDETGHGHDGRVSGATWRNDGVKGGCYEFDGINDCIVVSNHYELNPEEITISFWAQEDPSLDGQYCRVMGKIEPGLSAGWELYMNWHIAWRICPSYEADSIQVGAPYSAAWVHVAVTLTGRDAVMYTNGVEASRKTMSTGFVLGCDEPWYIGTYLAAGQTWFRGRVDEVKVWGRALQATEIAHEAQRGNIAPYINVTPVKQVVKAGKLANITLSYGDQDGTPVTFEAVNMPANAQLLSNNTLVSWITAASDIGTNNFSFRVIDAGIPVLTASAAAIVVVEPTYVVTTGMIAYWSMDAPGSTAVDETGRGHNGRVSGATWRSDGVKGGCYEFDGINDCIVVSNHYELNPEEITISFWAQEDPTLDGQYCRVMGKIEPGLSAGWELYMNWHIAWRICPSYEVDSIQVGTPYSAAWVHVAVTLTGRDAVMYTNGVEASRKTMSTGFVLGCDEPWYIGTYLAAGQTWFRGRVDEVKVWGSALSQDEIAREAHRPQSPFVTVAPTQQVVCAGQVATIAVAYGDPDGTAELSINGAPPAAVINSNKTSLTWTPGASDVGRHTVEFVATDNELLTASATAVIIVTQRIDRLEIVTAALPDGTVDVPYEAVLQAAGGLRPYAWTISRGTLPDGITLATNGTLAGQTAVAGNYSFMVRVTDGNNQFVERLFALSVADGTPATVRILTAALPDALIGEAYAVMLKATGGTPPYGWEIADGFLPAGMSLNPSNGVVRGTALGATNASFIVKVTDHNGNSDSKPLVIRVRPEDDYSLAINEISLAKFMINWRKHVVGPDDDVDHVWVRLTFAVPDGLTLEEHMPLTLFFGAYPIDGLNAEITPNGRRATYFEGDARNGELPVVKMIVQLRQNGGQPLGIVYAIVRYADLDGELGALNETIVDGRLTVPVQLLIGAYEGCGAIEMRYDSKKNRKGKGKYPIN